MNVVEFGPKLLKKNVKLFRSGVDGRQRMEKGGVSIKRRDNARPLQHSPRKIEVKIYRGEESAITEPSFITCMHVGNSSTHQMRSPPKKLPPRLTRHHCCTAVPSTCCFYILLLR